jgi:hypothetical protein
MWTQDGRSPGPGACSAGYARSWSGAMVLVRCLNTNSYLGYGDWRLANREELLSLVDYGQNGPALPPSHPFTVNYSSKTWSSTTNFRSPTTEWAVHFQDGKLWFQDAVTNSHTWPVRGGLTLAGGAQVWSDVSVDMTDSPDPVDEGSSLTYTLTVSSGGPDAAAGVELLVALPAESPLLSVATTQGSCVVDGRALTCALGSLAVGASATVTAEVRAGVGPVLTATASLSTTTLELDPGDDRTETATQVVATDPVFIDGFANGSTSEWSLTVP